MSLSPSAKGPFDRKKVFSNSANVRYMCMPRSSSRVHVYSVNDGQGHLKVKFRQSWRPPPFRLGNPGSATGPNPVLERGQHVNRSFLLVCHTDC